MSPELYACVYVGEFPAQALLRLNPELATQPVAVLDGRPPLQTVCSLNRLARLTGASLGMTRLEAESIYGLRLIARSPETEAAARAVLFESAAQFSPRLEDVSQQTACSCVLDIAGTERLFGPPETLARNLRAALATAGFHASFAVSANFHTARLKAAAARGITVIPPQQESAALGKLPLAVLGLAEDPAETFAIWGIRTLAELAALPESDLVARLGPQAVDWRKLALGTHSHAFQPIEADFSLEEFCAFETPVEQIDSLLFIGARMIDCLATRASARALSLASLIVEMQLESGHAYQRTIRPALATIDRKFLLKLLQLEIAAHPPQAAVLSLTLSAQAGQSSKVQLGLFAPQTPEPSRLDVTIARLKAIAGDDRVGSPVLEDTHRPGSFRMESFSIANPSSAGKLGESEPAHPRMALRRVRPPAPVRVQLDTLRPVAFRDPEQCFKVAAAYGPWRTSGCWWSTEAWNTEEWDVLAESSGGASVACLLVRDCTRNQWQLEAFYD
ncbi:MAG TPA: DNA polymerase Y family protein [Terracidiphilus sp.]|nr:DNA polymerase Y family protein [Terracidiphilus sp.]